MPVDGLAGQRGVVLSTPAAVPRTTTTSTNPQQRRELLLIIELATQPRIAG
jgi:hypothetical protein